MQFSRVEGFAYVVVRSGVHTGHNCGRISVAGEEEHIDIRAPGTADLPADFRPIHDRHHPIEDRQLGTVIGFENLQSLAAIRHNGDFVPALREVRLELG